MVVVVVVVVPPFVALALLVAVERTFGP